MSERAALVRSVRRVKSRVQAVLHANLVPKYAGHLFGKGGRRWLATAPLPKAERDLLARHLDELDWLNGELEKLDCALARISLDDARTRKLMSIAGISSVIATAVIAAIGDISRFPTPARLASYFGLTPRVRQSGERSAVHGRISKQGNAIARTMLIEAAWSAASVPGPLRAFFLRIKDRKGLNVAAVATARKIADLIWQLLTKDVPYRWARPAFVAMKMRKLELRAGAARAHGPAGSGRDYWIKEIRHREMELVAQAEAAYAAHGRSMEGQAKAMVNRSHPAHRRHRLALRVGNGNQRDLRERPVEGREVRQVKATMQGCNGGGRDDALERSGQQFHMEMQDVELAGLAADTIEHHQMTRHPVDNRWIEFRGSAGDQPGRGL